MFSGAKAQILSDTVEVYNAKSTRYYYAKDFWDTVTTYHDLDTSIVRSHHYNYAVRNGKRYQDLGIMGTAIKPVFQELPTKLGYQPGYTAYDFYQIKLEDIKFYDTKSPFSCIDYVQSTAGEASLTFDFSRNVNPNWNAGFTVRRMTSKRVYGKTGNKSLDKLGDDYAINVYTAYRNKNSRYGALISFATMRHTVYEYGGIQSPHDTPDSLNGRKIASIPVWFSKTSAPTTALTYDNRTELNVYQQFHIDTTHKIAVFLQTDLLDRVNGYTIGPDVPVTTGTGYFGKDQNKYNATFSDYHNNFKSLTNTLGLKWGSKILDAKAYYKLRNSSYDEIFNQSRHSLSRIYLDDQYYGALANVKIAPKVKLVFDYESQLSFQKSSYSSTNTDSVSYPGSWNNKNDLKYSATLNLYGLQAGYKFIRYSPSIQQTFLDQNHYRWGTNASNQNNFDATESSELFANWQYYADRVGFSLKGRYTESKNLIYLDTNKRFTQSADKANMLMLDARVLFRLSRINFDLGYIYGQNTGAKIIRVPENTFNPIVYYSGYVLKKELKLNVGFEANYMSGYYADAYNVALQTFYLQDRVQVQNYWNLDFFANMHFRKTDIFLKIVNITQPLGGPRYYFVTPGYGGMITNFTFGIKWYFYN